MKKVVKKYGNSLIITIDKEEADIYKIKKGDIVDIEIVKENGKHNIKRTTTRRSKKKS